MKGTQLGPVATTLRHPAPQWHMAAGTPTLLLQPMWLSFQSSILSQGADPPRPQLTSPSAPSAAQVAAPLVIFPFKGVNPLSPQLASLLRPQSASPSARLPTQLFKTSLTAVTTPADPKVRLQLLPPSLQREVSFLLSSHGQQHTTQVAGHLPDLPPQ